MGNEKTVDTYNNIYRFIKNKIFYYLDTVYLVVLSSSQTVKQQKLVI